MTRTFVVCLVLAFATGAAAVMGQSRNGQARIWWNAGSGERFPSFSTYDDENGALAVLSAGGAVETKGHPFFEALGRNGRACIACHQPSSGMSLSVEAVRQRRDATQGRDPLFAAIDGSNCPSLPQSPAASHSLLPAEEGIEAPEGTRGPGPSSVRRRRLRSPRRRRRSAPATSRCSSISTPISCRIA